MTNGLTVMAAGAAFFLLAACDGGGGSAPPPPPPPTTGWVFENSPAMTAPSPNGSGGYVFSFPPADGVHYLIQSRGPLVGVTALDLDYEVQGEGNLVGSDAAQDTCGGPAHFQLYIRRQGARFIAAHQFWHWFHPPRGELTPGRRRMVAPLTPDQWASMFAQQNAAEFGVTLAGPTVVGLTFGRGCFAGHGLYLSGGGPVTFTIHGLVAQ